MIWMEVEASGKEKTNGRKPEEVCLVQTVIYWSKLFFHMTIVPPFALSFVRGSKLSRRSSE